MMAYEEPLIKRGVRMKINHNITAMIANNTLNNNHNAMATAIQRLSSGYRINHARMIQPVWLFHRKCVHRFEDCNRRIGTQEMVFLQLKQQKEH